MASRLSFGPDARAALIDGLDPVADAVGVTLGPKGRYVVLGRAVTDDGATVARELARGSAGARLIGTVASAMEQLAGDGTTTATVLAQAMIRDGLRMVAAGADPAALRRGIEHGVARAVEHLAERQAIGIAGRAQTARVAAVAAGDEQIGALVAEAFEAVGADGVVKVQRGESGATELELTEGVRFYQGYLSPYMVTVPESGEAVLDDPHVFIANERVTDAEQLLPVLERVAPTGRPLLVIADDVRGSALGLLVLNRCVAVKARHVGRHRRGHLEELAIYTGADWIGDGLRLGRAARAVVTRNTTTLVDGSGDRGAVRARVDWLRREIDATEHLGDRNQLEERLGELAGVRAVIRYGAGTETELEQLRLRIEDAVGATRAALREGIVPGGGLALLEAGDAIDENGLGSDEAAGAAIVRRALAHPARRIADNAGLDGAVAVERARALPAGDGLDVISGEYGDMIDAGIVDPALVVRVALQSAASLAKLVLATEVVAATDDGAAPRLRHGAGARLALQTGVEAVARAVGVTLGPRGRNVLLDGQLTSDGAAVARTIDLADAFEARGAGLVREAAGEGTTTATLLAAAIVREGQRNVAAGADPLALRRGMTRAVEQAAAHLSDVQSIDVGARLAAVATNAAGDETLGSAVADAFERVGRDGVVAIEHGHTLGLELEVALGMRWRGGPVLGDPTELEHPYVLCVDQRISAAGELLPALELVVESGRPLLLVVLALDGEARRMLAANTRRVASVAVMAPDFLERRRRNLEDIAAVTGGEAITEELGRGLAHVRLEQLGTARRVVVTKDATTIVGGAGDPAAVEARAEALRRELARGDQAPFFRERLRQRLARLAGGVATIKVGAATEAEARERVVRAEGAVRAAEAALRGGIVPGGGTALLRARDAIGGAGPAPDENTGAAIVRRALETPLRRIAENSGLDGATAVARVGALGPREGFDAAAGEYRDLVAAGVVDPTLVVRSALENAASVAKTVLMAECVAAAG